MSHTAEDDSMTDKENGMGTSYRGSKSNQGSLSEVGVRLSDLVLHDIRRDCEGESEDSPHFELESLQLKLNDELIFDSAKCFNKGRVADSSTSSELEELRLRLTLTQHTDRHSNEKVSGSAGAPSPSFPEQQKEELDIPEATEEVTPPYEQHSIGDDEAATRKTLSFTVCALVAKRLKDFDGQYRALGVTPPDRRKTEGCPKLEVCRKTEATQTKDASVPAIPRYLIRPGAPISTAHNIPVAWPPMTDYKSAVIFVDAESFPSAACTSFVLLKDGKDDIGLALADSHEVADSLTQDSHLLLQLIRHKSWLMDRPIVLIADSSVGEVKAGYDAEECSYKWEYSSLEVFVAEYFPHFDQLQVCRCPELKQYLKSLLSCL